MLPEKLANKIHQRKTENALRTLGTSLPLTDFSSNDYLGFSKSEQLFNAAHAYLAANNIKHNGAAGSRLLSGNHSLYPKLEHMLSEFHNSEAALIFNSGYDANIGLFSSLPQRGDVVLYDEHIHASIRDGISMSHAKAYKFKHNNLTHLGELLKRYQQSDTIYVVTESVFSMDGDSPDLRQLSNLCKAHHAYLIIDEAHAIGILGNNGSGLVQATGLEQHVFARLVTYGKALGCHGAAVLGSKALKQYLINFSRSFIYTTALPPHSLAAIQAAYQELPSHIKRAQLHENIKHFKNTLATLQLTPLFIPSNSAIHCCIISGNKTVKAIAKKLQAHQFDVRPILSPTVPKNQERLRFCLHSYNSKDEISEVLQLLATFVPHEKPI